MKPELYSTNEHTANRRKAWLVAAWLIASAMPLASAVVDLTTGEPARGKFLIASRSLRDPNFRKTVILLVDYGRDGAMGVIINRPTDRHLAELLPESEALKARQDRIWLGGPVAPWQMCLLTRSDEGVDESRPVLDGVHFSTSRFLLEELADRGAHFRVYAGYAGWSPGQLEHEIARGGWHLLPGDADMVFDEAPFEVWPELIVRSSTKWARLHLRGLAVGLLPIR